MSDISRSIVLPKRSLVNLSKSALLEKSVMLEEGVLSDHGALMVDTGVHTGRSPKDKYIVKDEVTEHRVWWKKNKPMLEEHFEILFHDMHDFINDKLMCVQDLYACADHRFTLNVRFITQRVWHGLFIRNLLRIPSEEQLKKFTPEFEVINCPEFKASPKKHGCDSETVIAISFKHKKILIAGTSYAGENKKSIFSVLNFTLLNKGVMPIHCSANHALDLGKEVAIFCGLSGTGKTTLSSDPHRVLIGDDEHGWSDHGIFNFEGGCYAKTINLSKDLEPEIYGATQKFATVLENVIYDEHSRIPDFFDSSKTENTRAAYSLHALERVSLESVGGHPANIIMLTCDAFGVLPPIARLTADQAAYHFISGFTSKISGTEKGITEPQPTFSYCFGAPFMPCHPVEYAKLLSAKIAKYKVNCWLLNTGWSGGSYGVGKRMPLSMTRKLLDLALQGGDGFSNFMLDEHFGFAVPRKAKNFDSDLLIPRNAWQDKAAYDQRKLELIKLFLNNMKLFDDKVDVNIIAAGPKV